MKNDKSVLIINTPKSCGECPCCYVLENDWGDFISARCQMKYKGFVDKYSEYNKGRPEWCPLRQLPEKIECERCRADYDLCQGFNRCIEIITGEYDE